MTEFTIVIEDAGTNYAAYALTFLAASPRARALLR